MTQTGKRTLATTSGLASDFEPEPDFEALHRRILACRLCVDRPLGPPLVHEPRPILRPSRTARLVIASQAPGLRAHASGIPFHDRSGERLREWLALGADVFYDAERVVIAPMGFCFPGYDANGSDRPPRAECAATWHERLFAAMPQVETIVMIGAFAQRYHLRRCGRADELGPTLTDTVSRWRAIARRTGPRLFPLPHPSWRNTAWLKRHPWFEAELLPALRAEVREKTGISSAVHKNLC